MARGQIRMKAYIPERKYELASIYFVLGRKVSINNRIYTQFVGTKLCELPENLQIPST
jgi:hypothetical protein